jgi:GDP-L-fucose synthase
VDDLAAAAVFCLENWDPSGIEAPKDQSGEPLHYLNVGSGSDVTVKELAELIAEKIGFKGLINWDISKPDGTPQKLLDVNQLQSMGWSASMSLAEGLKKVIINLPSALIPSN